VTGAEEGPGIVYEMKNVLKEKNEKNWKKEKSVVNDWWMNEL